jgi:glutathione peroxidase
MSGSIFSAFSLLFAPRQGVLDPHAPETAMGDIAFTGINGETISLSSYAGQTVVVVNTASKCGFRQQMCELQLLHQDFHQHGFQVLCMPSADFWNQEPGDARQISEIYRSQLNITFPLTEKVKTRGTNQHPFFQRVGSIAGTNAIPKWNFYKYVIARNGHLAAWFSTPIRPSSPCFRSTIEAYL